MIKKFGTYFLIIFPVICYLILLNKFVLDFPFKDDYRVFVRYLTIFLQTDTLKEGLATLLIPDNESHPVLMRFITLLQYKIDGVLNFRHIILFCNIATVLFASALGSHFYKKKEYWNIALMSLLVFNIFHHEMYFRSDVVTYQLLSFSFAILLFYGAVYYKSLPTIARVLFFVIFLSIPFGSVNGMLASALVILYFFSEKQKKMGAILLLIFILQLVFLNSLDDDSKPFNIVERVLEYNFELVYAYFLALGGILEVTGSDMVWNIIVVVSALVFGYTFYKLFFPFKWGLDFEQLIFIFCSVSLALIVVLRYNYWMSGYVGVLESRYKLYGALIFLLFFASLIRSFKKSKNIIALTYILGSGIFILGLYKGYNSLITHNLDEITAVYNVYGGVYEDTYARDFTANAETKEVLKEHKAYSFLPVKELFDNFLTEENKIHADLKGAFVAAHSDPIRTGERRAEPKTLKTFRLEGEIPSKNYYFILFKGENGTLVVENITRPPVSLIEKITGGDSGNTVNELWKDFYPDAFVGIDFNDFELYGVDDLGI